MNKSTRTPRGQDALGAGLIALVFIALGGLAFSGWILRAPPTELETLCRADGVIAAHTIVLVDATDKLEPRHRRKLRAVLAQERARLGQYDRFTLMRLNARRPQEPAVLFSKCLPRPPERANPWFQNPRLAQQAWDADFADALERALRSAQSGGAQSASPILAGIRAVAADPDFGAEIPRRRLVLVSDLLEHNPQGFSLYVSAVDYAAWAARAPAGPPDLSAIDLRLVPLDRPDHGARQAAAMAHFWPAYFAAAQARSVSIDPAP